MKAFVSAHRCIGCGICAATCPGVFSIGDDEKSHPITGEIPEGSMAGSNNAKEHCPANAIALEL